MSKKKQSTKIKWLELDKELKNLKGMFTVCLPDGLGNYIVEIHNGEHIPKRQYKWKFKESFIDFFNKVYKDDKTLTGVIEALSALNSRLISDSNTNYAYFDKTTLDNQVLEFTEYFIDEFYDDDIEELIWEFWGEDGCLVIEEGVELSEKQERKFINKTYGKFSLKQKAFINQVVFYISNLSKEFSFLFVCDDDERDSDWFNETKETFEDEYLDRLEFELKYALCSVLKKNGSFFLYKYDETGITLSGFYYLDGEFGLMPEESFEYDEFVHYEGFPIKL